MIKIISFTICPFVQRVTALLEAKAIPYEVKLISLSNKPEWFIALSPNGQVPLLTTESGITLFESDAIVEYLEEAYPSLENGVSVEQKALDRAWSYLATKHYLVQCSAMRSANKTSFEENRVRLNKAFDRIETALENKPFFKGEALSNVDIAWLPLLHRAAIVQQYNCYDFFDKYPNIKLWQRGLLNTGLAEASIADDFKEKFVDFYLSEKTYLGSKERCNIECNLPCKDNRCCA